MPNQIHVSVLFLHFVFCVCCNTVYIFIFFFRFGLFPSFIHSFIRSFYSLPFSSPSATTTFSIFSELSFSVCFFPCSFWSCATNNNLSRTSQYNSNSCWIIWRKKRLTTTKTCILQILFTIPFFSLVYEIK